MELLLPLCVINRNGLGFEYYPSKHKQMFGTLELHFVIAKVGTEKTMCQVLPTELCLKTLLRKTEMSMLLLLS